MIIVSGLKESCSSCGRGLAGTGVKSVSTSYGSFLRHSFYKEYLRNVDTCGQSKFEIYSLENGLKVSRTKVYNHIKAKNHFVTPCF